MLLLCTLAIGLITSQKANADHIIGSDISYTCSSTNDSILEVVYNFYRDCNGCYVMGQSPKFYSAQSTELGWEVPLQKGLKNANHR